MRIFPCAYLPLRVCICPREFALEFAIARLPSQDFVRDLPIVNHHCRTLLAIHPWSILIAGLCSRSTCSQSSSQDFARDLPVVNPHCRTSLAIHPWSNLIAGLCSRSTLGQSSSHDCRLAILQTNLGQPAIAPSVPDRSAIYPSSPAP